ncbi:PLP-dependent aminotransferase family protein [Methylobacterium gossipiicola]|uniref:8-amino-7-oxononanoate synthase n=1 Tax=Methylobacterium gossipiicola TaxID=582675 RepID=A0A1I2XHT0_9HYPH|nr:PLP-dependent aminotransferase family protein [Methylobacterium gossipiicola]SFH11621.1 DNA-binding transcriptional regulator, MocR family, contains an aminotransferase domain [Methylobacterium gossipiicola]
MTDYRVLADGLVEDIATGRMPPGTRLPPQRSFAYAQGIAVSTASRVYAELVRRGLVTGETGRGTYVRPQDGAARLAFAEPPATAVDLERIYSVLPDHTDGLSRTIQDLLRSDRIKSIVAPVAAAGDPDARAVAARFLARPGWTPGADPLLFTGNGRQAVASALAALAPPGERIGVEALTYPVVKGIAARLGITLVPLALDGEGLCPDALAQAHRTAPLRGIYLQPSLHNPLGITMGPERRAALAESLDAHGLFAVEDAIYGFLSDAVPLAAFAPERTILVDSLSKRVAPGFTLGFIAAPPLLVDRIALCVRSGGWGATGLPFAVGRRLMESGEAARIGLAKREDARARQALARDILADLALRGDPQAYHLWLALPETWRAETFVAAAARRGIAVTPANAFAVHAGHAPNAVRLALASPPLDALAPALTTLRQLARDGDDSPVE